MFSFAELLRTTSIMRPSVQQFWGMLSNETTMCYSVLVHVPTEEALCPAKDEEIKQLSTSKGFEL